MAKKGHREVAGEIGSQPDQVQTTLERSTEQQLVAPVPDQSLFEMLWEEMLLLSPVDSIFYLALGLSRSSKNTIHRRLTLSADLPDFTADILEYVGMKSQEGISYGKRAVFTSS